MMPYFTVKESKDKKPLWVKREWKPSREKNHHKDDNMVSPAQEKDAVIIDDEEKKVVNQAKKELSYIPPIVISGSTQVNVLSLEPIQEKVQKAQNDDDDNDDDVDFGYLSAFDKIFQLAM